MRVYAPRLLAPPPATPRPPPCPHKMSLISEVVVRYLLKANTCPPYTTAKNINVIFPRKLDIGGRDLPLYYYYEKLKLRKSAKKVKKSKENIGKIN